jgi:hypothetical protein
MEVEGPAGVAENLKNRAERRGGLVDGLGQVKTRMDWKDAADGIEVCIGHTETL